MSFAISVNADSDKFPAWWLFHDRWKKGKKGETFYEDRKVAFITVGGRTSAFVPDMQKLRKATVLKRNKPDEDAQQELCKAIKEDPDGQELRPKRTRKGK